MEFKHWRKRNFLGRIKYMKDNDITLKQIANKWLEEQKKVLNKNSYAVYKSEVYRYIIPELGEVRNC